MGERNITGVVLEPHPELPYWVEAFSLEISVDGRNWLPFSVRPADDSGVSAHLSLRSQSSGLRESKKLLSHCLNSHPLSCLLLVVEGISRQHERRGKERNPLRKNVDDKTSKINS